MNKRSESKEKKPYSPPKLTKLTAPQVTQFVMDRTDCSDQEAEDLLDSLLREFVAVVGELGKDLQLLPIGNHLLPAEAVLRSWKDVARYVGTCVKTVQRWEDEFQFPIRRANLNKGAVVFALRSEVDKWLRERTG